MNFVPRAEGQGETNVLGEALQPCSSSPLTGFYRSAYCAVGPNEARHLVCIVATAEFLAFSQSVGNDLSTARPEMAFPGLNPGDRWCLVAERWAQALFARAAPRVVLQATNHAVLEILRIEDLRAHAADLN